LSLPAAEGGAARLGKRGKPDKKVGRRERRSNARGELGRRSTSISQKNKHQGGEKRERRRKENKTQKDFFGKVLIRKKLGEWAEEKKGKTYLARTKRITP